MNKLTDLEVALKLEEIEREQETLEEFINYTLRFNTIADKEVYSQLIREGAKWQKQNLILTENPPYCLCAVIGRSSSQIKIV